MNESFIHSLIFFVCFNRIYKKAKEKGKDKKKVTYIVAKRVNAGKRYKKPRGVKGPYKVVDPRMKKDARRQKNNLKGKSGRKKNKR